MDLSHLGTFDRVYAYARVSSQTQYERQTIDVQVNRLKGANPPPAILFQDVQGGDESDRPDYQRLIGQATSDAIAGLKVLIVVTEQSRLSRGGVDAVTDLIEMLNALGVTLYALDDGLLTVAEAGQWLAIGSKALFHKYFLHEIRGRLRAGRAQRRKEGKPVQPNAPLGYRWTKERLELNEDAAIARQLFEKYLPPPLGEGWSLAKCVKWLAEQGHSYSQNGVSMMLKNPVYRGILAHSIGGHTREEQKRGVRHKPKDFIYDAHPALITHDEWKLIERQLEDNKQYARRGTNSPRYPLSGLTRCDRCKGRMTIQTTTQSGKRYHSYQCRPCHQGVSYRIVEAAVITALCDHASDLARIVDASPESDQPSPEVMQVRRELDELRALYKRQPLGGIKSAIAELEAKLAKLEQQKTGQSGIDPQMLIGVLSNPTAYAALPDPEKRLLFHELVSKVWCDRRNIGVELNF